MVAGGTACAVIKNRIFRQGYACIHTLDDFFFNLYRGFAFITNPPDKPLGDYKIDRRGQKIRLDAHIDHPADCAGRIVGVERT